MNESHMTKIEKFKNSQIEASERGPNIKAFRVSGYDTTDAFVRNS